MLENRMVNMLLFETKLPFASYCRSTWPHCNTVYCQWGRYDTTDITNINAIAAARVSPGKLREMAFPWKIRELSGNLPNSSWNFLKQQNLRDFSGNGRLLLLIMLRSFSYVLPSVSRQNHWKNKPFTNSPRADICNIYLPMVNCWMACIHPNDGVHFHFLKILMLWT